MNLATQIKKVNVVAVNHLPSKQAPSFFSSKQCVPHCFNVFINSGIHLP
ncbi:hypothetical protein ACI8B_50539 [Acinetobacter proteolyticus]|uniref:Uncharacterized protein n=1 Tax=Acinetobacter proteolyticus TaxID=1776741 RepID=A0A653KAX8_9GAMM|nr:hypothetical protein ACI8B_50539 [Acinetobacter proteolyticus]